MAAKEGALDGVDGVHLVQDRNRWWVFVKGVINLLVSEKVENFSTSWKTLSFQINIFYPWSQGSYSVRYVFSQLPTDKLKTSFDPQLSL